MSRHNHHTTPPPLHYPLCLARRACTPPVPSATSPCTRYASTRSCAAAAAPFFSPLALHLVAHSRRTHARLFPLWITQERPQDVAGAAARGREGSGYRRRQSRPSQHALLDQELPQRRRRRLASSPPSPVPLGEPIELSRAAGAAAPPVSGRRRWPPLCAVGSRSNGDLPVQLEK